jgi:hypothetical protein
MKLQNALSSHQHAQCCGLQLKIVEEVISVHAVHTDSDNYC